MTPNQKLLKNKLLSYVDRLIAHVDDLKAAGAMTSLDRMLAEQRKRIHDAESSEVLLQVSDGSALGRYIDRIDALEDSCCDDDDSDPSETKILERKSEALDEFLEKIGRDIDGLHAKVKAEDEKFGNQVAASEVLGLLADRLSASGAKCAIAIGFKSKSLSERVAERKARKRWLKTPAGKASQRKAKLRAKRPHMIDRNRSKAAKLAHRAYRY